MLDELLTLSPRDLHARLGRGAPIDPASLDDTEFHGIALGLPAFVEKLAWKTFKKVFKRDPVDGGLRGWNVAVEQRGVHGPFVDRRRRDGTIKHYWPYEVHAARDYPVPGPYDWGLMIDYGAANPWWDPQNRMRDPLVSLDGEQADLLLGYTYVELGIARLRTPTYFALVRGGPLTYDPYPRGAR